MRKVFRSLQQDVKGIEGFDSLKIRLPITYRVLRPFLAKDQRED